MERSSASPHKSAALSGTRRPPPRRAQALGLTDFGGGRTDQTASHPHPAPTQRESDFPTSEWENNTLFCLSRRIYVVLQIGRITKDILQIVFGL